MNEAIVVTLTKDHDLSEFLGMRATVEGADSTYSIAGVVSSGPAEWYRRNDTQFHLEDENGWGWPLYVGDVAVIQP